MLALCCGLLLPFCLVVAQSRDRRAAYAELTFGENLVTLTQRAQVRVEDSSTATIRLHLISGAIVIRVPQSGYKGLSVVAGDMRILPKGPGVTRISRLEGGTTLITARSGHADVLTSHGVQKISQGQTLEARFNGQSLEFETSNEVPRDDLDTWVERQNEKSEIEEARGWNDRECQAYATTYSQYGAAFNSQIQPALPQYSAADPYVSLYSFGPYGRTWRPGGIGVFGLGGPGMALNFGGNPRYYPGVIAPPFQSFDQGGWHRSGSYFRPYAAAPNRNQPSNDGNGWHRSGQFRGSGGRR